MAAGLGLSTAAEAGISVGAIVAAVALFALIGWKIFKLRRRKNLNHTRGSDDSSSKSEFALMPSPPPISSIVRPRSPSIPSSSFGGGMTKGSSVGTRRSTRSIHVSNMLRDRSDLRLPTHEDFGKEVIVEGVEPTEDQSMAAFQTAVPMEFSYGFRNMRTPTPDLCEMDGGGGTLPPIEKG